MNRRLSVHLLEECLDFGDVGGRGLCLGGGEKRRQRKLLACRGKSLLGIEYGFVVPTDERTGKDCPVGRLDMGDKIVSGTFSPMPKLAPRFRYASVATASPKL